MRNVFLRRTRDVGTSMPARRSPPSTPRWVKVSVIIFIVLVLLFLILHLTGHGFGDHMHMAIRAHGGQQL